MSECTATVIESQLDWLTLAVHNHQKTDQLRDHAQRWAEREVKNGERVAPWRLNGYIGWRAGRVRYGERENAGLVQLSGDLAAARFDTLWPLRDNVSRLDVAVTVRADPPQPDHGRQAYLAAVAFREAHPRAARPSQHADADGGWTTYIGDRSSDYFLRVYDKEAEQRGDHDDAGAERYRACWRYELECKGFSAASVGLSLARAADRPAFCQSLLHQYACAHGIEPIFADDGQRVLSPGFRRRSDRDTRLAWLHRSVKPAIEYLLQTGTREEVMQALGLQLDGE
jgi:DNA relaxase NicK